jgi:putative redox protein
MKATARRVGTYRHEIAVRGHGIAADEPSEHGGGDTAPSPQELLAASLASCTAVTMEMYASRKGWELPDVEVSVEYQPSERGCPTRFDLVVRVPSDVSEEDAQRLMTIAAKCPVHRTLEGEVMFTERIERVAAPAQAA